MTNNQRAEMLLPMSGAGMDDKWRAAWALLDELPDVEPHLRAAACCWLIYRGIDGFITDEEMERRVLPKAKHGILTQHQTFTRWEMSISAAAFYYHFLKARSKEAGEYRQRLKSVGQWWEMHPPSILSYLRIECIAAYCAFLDGAAEEAKHIIRRSIGTWQRVMADIDWTQYPTRWLDARGDMDAMHAMMCIADKLGVLAYPVETKTIQDLNLPWVCCMKKLRDKPGAIWK
jgi:hypothetical protein